MTTSMKLELKEIYKNTKSISLNEFLAKKNISTLEEDVELLALNFDVEEEIFRFIVRKEEEFFLIEQNESNELRIRNVEDLDDVEKDYEAYVFESNEDAELDKATLKKLTLKEVTLTTTKQLDAIYENNFFKVDELKLS